MPGLHVGDLVEHVGGLAMAFAGAARKSPVPGGVEMPGDIAAAVALNEVVVHGWDLAAALGRPYPATDVDITACMVVAEPFSTPDTAGQRGDAFGPVVPVPADAPPLARLLGMMGQRMEEWPVPAGAAGR